MANVNKSPKVQTDLSHTGFDMQQTLKFTSSVGQLLPVYFDILNPNEKVTLNSQLVSRTVRPLKAPAFTEIEEHVDWFFVPMRVLYSVFEQVFFGISDVHSSMFSNTGFSNKFPTYSLQKLCSTFRTIYNMAATGGSSPVRTKDAFGVPIVQNAIRLAELFGIGSNWADDTYVPTTFPTVRFNALIPAAYQAIYYSYYRLSSWENNNQFAYNLDSTYTNGDADLSVLELFKLHYRPYKRDLFTNVYPEPLISSTSVGMLNTFVASQVSVNDPKINTRQFGPERYLDTAGQVLPSQVVVSDVSANLATQPVNTASLRGMFALEKLLEITRRAGKHVDDQVSAHFGVKPVGNKYGEVIHICSQSSIFQIDQTVATAASSNSGSVSNVGDLAGNAYGAMDYNENSATFETHDEHGILMAIYSCVPQADYDAGVLIDRLNSYSDVSHYYRPEFDNLGMQPLFKYQSYNIEPIRFGVNGEIVSWQYRYSELKQKYNRVAGALNNSLSYWTTCRNAESTIVPTGSVSDMYLRYTTSPTMLNRLVDFQFPYTIENVGTPASDCANVQNTFVYDPFIHMIHFGVSKSSTMNTYSLSHL